MTRSICTEKAKRWSEIDQRRIQACSSTSACAWRAAGRKFDSFRFNLGNEAITSLHDHLAWLCLLSPFADNLIGSLALVIPRASCLLSSPERVPLARLDVLLVVSCFFHFILLAFPLRARLCQASAESVSESIISFSRIPIKRLVFWGLPSLQTASRCLQDGHRS